MGLMTLGERREWGEGGGLEVEKGKAVCMGKVGVSRISPGSRELARDSSMSEMGEAVGRAGRWEGGAPMSRWGLTFSGDSLMSKRERIVALGCLAAVDFFCGSVLTCGRGGLWAW